MKKTVSIDNYNKPFPTTLRSLIERKKTTITAVAELKNSLIVFSFV